MWISLNKLTTVFFMDPLNCVYSCCMAIQHRQNPPFLSQKVQNVPFQLEDCTFVLEMTLLPTWGSYRAIEWHVPKAIVPPRPQETTLGVLLAEQATWHVSSLSAAILLSGDEGGWRHSWGRPWCKTSFKTKSSARGLVYKLVAPKINMKSK